MIIRRISVEFVSARKNPTLYEAQIKVYQISQNLIFAQNWECGIRYSSLSFVTFI